MENKSQELEVAIKAALAAGKILEKYFDTKIEKRRKEDSSTVILADKETEDKILEIIKSAFPKHSILAEESGHTNNYGNYTWHIDPLDGTTNFANGIPIFATSIALEREGSVVVGVIHNPVTNSLFYAEKGKGAYFNDKKISVSKEDATTGMITMSSSRRSDEKKLARKILFYLPERVAYFRCFGSVASELAYVAKGVTEGVFLINLKTHDFAAGSLLVQEAGGKITKLDGSAWEFPENSFIASNGVFHDILVEEIMKQKKLLGMQ